MLIKQSRHTKAPWRDDSSDASTDAKTTYSRSGPTVEDADSNGMMTSTVSFEITTSTDNVSNLSTVGTKLSSGTWGAAGYSKVTTCIKIASDTDTPYECRETMMGAIAGSFFMYNAAEVGPSTDNLDKLICSEAWTVKEKDGEYDITWPTETTCAAAGVTIDHATAVTIDSTSWTFAATYVD